MECIAHKHKLHKVYIVLDLIFAMFCALNSNLSEHVIPPSLLC